ncbi:helix-turn-helix domain-containing protein [Nocardia barduliensis]|uniref:helix-turn-helix domain-containing protein n=1 Tax=Nocardia barduliensis TaxID=2736643 RepID=UPI001574B865|nr:helix-turn-helix domain-containing protein [Nocardia barduliensis]
MTNDRLRDALLRNGLTPQTAAEALRVSTKTVERWVRNGRIPYPRHRFEIAALVKESESFLWPEASTPERVAEVASSEVVAMYPHRHEVPRDLWLKLFDQTTEQLDILVYAGMFLTDDTALLTQLQQKARRGTSVRIMLGDPRCAEVKRRTEEEQIGKGAIAAKIRNVLAFFKPVIHEPGIEFRLHKTTLYNSIYRFDSQMIVNMHVHGRMAPQAPAMHIRQLSEGSLFDVYTQSFNDIWRMSKPYVPPRDEVDA